MDLNHYTQKPASGNAPKQIIVLLHGYGSNGRDLISLAPYWAPAIPDALFVSPDAPFSCEMGGEGFQWFSLAEYTPQKLLEGAKQAHPILDNYVDKLLATYNLKDENLALVGFSQGTMMSLYTGLRRNNTLAGILGYSGALAGLDEIESKNRPPIHLIHGEADSVIPVMAYHKATQDLTAEGYTVTGHATPYLEHSIDGQGIESGSNFLKTIFK